MSLKVAVVLLVLGVASFNDVQAKRACAGCPTEGDVNNPAVISSVKNVLARSNAGIELVKILSVTEQVVAGKKLKVKFLAKNSKTQEDKICNVTLLQQPWKSKMDKILNFRCTKASA